MFFQGNTCDLESVVFIEVNRGYFFLYDNTILCLQSFVIHYIKLKLWLVSLEGGINPLILGMQEVVKIKILHFVAWILRKLGSIKKKNPPRGREEGKNHESCSLHSL